MNENNAQTPVQADNAAAAYNYALAADFGENKLAGTVGAFLFALIGGLVYWILWQVGYLAAVSGLISVSCAFVGYRLFAKRESKYGIVISVVMAAIVILLAWYLCLAQDVYEAYKEWYKNGDIDYTVGFFTSVRYAYTFLSDGDIASSYISNLLISIGLCVVGCIAPIRSAAKKQKAAAQGFAPAAPVQQQNAAAPQQNFMPQQNAVPQPTAAPQENAAPQETAVQPETPVEQSVSQPETPAEETAGEKAE